MTMPLTVLLDSGALSDGLRRAASRQRSNVTASGLGERVISITAFRRLNARWTACRAFAARRWHRPSRSARRPRRQNLARRTRRHRRGRRRRRPSACRSPGAGRPKRRRRPTGRTQRPAGAGRWPRARLRARRRAGRCPAAASSARCAAEMVHQTARVGSRRSGRSSDVLADQQARVGAAPGIGDDLPGHQDVAEAHRGLAPVGAQQLAATSMLVISRATVA